ncbi:MAG: ABC transporter permease, partial [Acinetobacter sp.]
MSLLTTAHKAAIKPELDSATAPRLLKVMNKLKGLFIPVFALILGEILVKNGFIQPYLPPAPSSLWDSFLELSTGDLWLHIWTSTWRVFLGFFIGSS